MNESSVTLVRPPDELNETLLFEKCSDFARFHIWPLRSRLDARAWLANFKAADLPLARHLLNAFMYFSDDLTRQLFLAGIQGIAILPSWKERRGTKADIEWSLFLQSAHLTFVTGEVPSPADSGYLFARKARDYAGIPESRIASPEKVLARLASGAFETPVVFVDDFVGSGNQFIETWKRSYSLAGGAVSFESVADAARRAGKPLEVYYTPAVCTKYGMDNIESECRDVEVSAGNLLDERYSVFHPQSLIWPERLVRDGQEMVRRQSHELGFAEDGSEWGTYGFHELGLAVGFVHKTPDATIPLFRFRSQNWTPLVRDV